MPRRKEDLEKHTLNFFTGDFERVRTLYPGMEVGEVIRTILRNHIEAEEAKLPEVRVPLATVESVDV